MATGDYPVRDGDGNIIEDGNNGGSAGAPTIVQEVQSKSATLGPFSATAVGNLFALNVEDYTYATVHITGTFVGTISWEGSNDSTDGTDGDWRNIIATDSVSSGPSVDGASVTGVAGRYVPLGYKWLRGRVTAYTSGTIVGTVALKQGAWPAPRSVAATLLSGSATVGATVASASASVGTGTTNAKIKAAATTNLTNVKATAGKLMGYAFYNNTAAAKFIKLYNKASAPVIASDTALILATIIVPANGQAVLAYPVGKAFSSGLGYAITGLVGETDTTATAVDDVVGHIDYI